MTRYTLAADGIRDVHDLGQQIRCAWVCGDVGVGKGLWGIGVGDGGKVHVSGLQGGLDGEFRQSHDLDTKGWGAGEIDRRK